MQSPSTTRRCKEISRARTDVSCVLMPRVSRHNVPVVIIDDKWNFVLERVANHSHTRRASGCVFGSQRHTPKSIPNTLRRTHVFVSCPNRTASMSEIRRGKHRTTSVNQLASCRLICIVTSNSNRLKFDGELTSRAERHRTGAQNLFNEWNANSRIGPPNLTLGFRTIVEIERSAAIRAAEWRGHSRTPP